MQSLLIGCAGGLLLVGLVLLGLWLVMKPDDFSDHE